MTTPDLVLIDNTQPNFTIYKRVSAKKVSNHIELPSNFVLNAEEIEQYRVAPDLLIEKLQSL